MDRCHLLLFCALGTTISAPAQNLVPNYSFEDHTVCPDNYNQVERCAGWFRSLNNNDPEFHTEFLHACGTSLFQTPSNTWGSQVPLSGDGYMSMVTLAPTVQLDYRENIFTQLIAPLEVGKHYAFQVSISLADNSKFASNNFGAKLSTTPDFPIDNAVLLAWPEVITNSTDWTTLSVVFAADSAYRYLAIGNFMTDAYTTSITACPNCPYVLHGYYVDNACLVNTTEVPEYDCSVAFIPTAIREIKQAVLSIFPSIQTASQRILYVQLPWDGAVDLTVRDEQGRLIRSNAGISGRLTEFSTEGLADGSYFITATNRLGERLNARFVVLR